MKFLRKLPVVGSGRSLPSWERGLKLYANGITIREGIVAPLVGAWIEIPQMHRIIPKLCVAPLVGAWIEIARIAVLQFRCSVAPLVGAWIEIQKIGSIE